MRINQKVIVVLLFFFTLISSPAFSEEPSMRNELADSKSQTSTLAYLAGITGIVFSLGIGYRLRRIYDARRNGLTR